MSFLIIRNVIILGVILILTACSNQQAFIKGKSLLKKGEYTEAFAYLQEAVDTDPNNLEYKTYYYRQRETWIGRMIQDAETAQMSEQWDVAKEKYEQILQVDPRNTRAQDGIRNIESGRLNEKRIIKATELLEGGQLEGAKYELRLVLSETPNHKQARTLLSQIEQKNNAEKSNLTQLSSKFRKPITLEFRDANIKSVFELLSKTAGINFILDKEIRPDSKISIFVTNSTIESALQNILSTSQLSKKILNEKSILIYPNSKKADFEEKIVRTFYLNNVDPKQAQNLIKTVVKTKDLFIDEQMNILVMRDSEEAVRIAEKLINAYDAGDPEVLLEVEVMEISTNKLSELGLRWPSQVAVGVNGTGGNGQLTFDEAKSFNSSLGRISITDPALIISLRGSDSSSNLLANPHIRVKNRKKAKVHIGDRVPVITNTSTSTGFVAESVSYLDVGLKLNVEPSILFNNEVSIDIGLEVSNIVSEITSRNGTLTYRLGTRNANTTLRLKNGETQILAGLINDEERSTADRVPGISNLPILGRLFSSKKNSRNKTEIVLLITPRILRNIVPPDAMYVEFSAGTETGNSAVDMGNEGYNISAPQPTALDFIEMDVPMSTYGESPNQAESIMPEVLNIPPPPPLPVLEGSFPATTN